uniref:Replicative DNA helicase n=1 Tax=Balbiania investiens TaxID=111861 RepID=A0A4D6BLF2_9FLOR|nr:replication helicase subunit [Balbiania investiens]QBX88580.1 replication helicase subunit [Balbiania investiens]
MFLENHVKKYYEQLPPQNNLAEEILLGGILINTQVIQITIRELGPESFALETHQLIYRTTVEIYSRYKYIDSIILINTLWELNLLNKIGGITKILDLLKQAHIFMSNSVTNLTIDYYINLIKDKYLRRLLIQYGYNIIKLAHISSVPQDTMLFKANKYLTNIAYLLNKRNQEQVNFLLTEILLNLKHNKNSKTSKGLISGFKSLDSITNGFKNSDLIVIAGRPSMGKTSLVLSIVNNLINANNTGIGIFSLEMSKEQILYKLLSIACTIPVLRLTSGDINNTDWGKIQYASNRLINSSIYIDDTANLSISHLNSNAKILKNNFNQLNLIIIDYLQLIQLQHDNIKNRTEELSSITRGLKILAKDLNIPIIVLSQLNRNVESRISKRPLLSDLRESGCVESKTHIVIEYYITNLVHTHVTQKDIITLYQHAIHSKLCQYHYSLQCQGQNSVQLTHNHLILTPLKWKRNDQIKYFYCINRNRTKYTTKNSVYGKFYIDTITITNKSRAFDLEIRDTQSFIGNDYIILHNSIEQDADIVLLLYREAYYNQHTIDEQLTDLIIAKHRNGPTGIAQLNFNPDFSAFEEL